MKKTRTTILPQLSPDGRELTLDALGYVIGAGYKLPPICGGETPYEVATDTLNQQGATDTQTDCSSRKQ